MYIIAQGDTADLARRAHIEPPCMQSCVCIYKELCAYIVYVCAYVVYDTITALSARVTEGVPINNTLSPCMKSCVCIHRELYAYIVYEYHNMQRHSLVVRT